MNYFLYCDDGLVVIKVGPFPSQRAALDHTVTLDAKFPWSADEKRTITTEELDFVDQWTAQKDLELMAAIADHMT